MVEAADVMAQHYTITDNAFSYPLMPQYSTDPSFCPSEFELEVEGALDGVLTFDEATQTFELGQITDSLALSGNTETSYTVTLTYKVSNQDGLVQSFEKQFEFTVKNPCVDPNFVTVSDPTVNALTYIVDNPTPTTDVHGEALISTVPITHTLCGTTVTYTAIYDGTVTATTTS